jgi:hypothetical protein
MHRIGKKAGSEKESHERSILAEVDIPPSHTISGSVNSLYCLVQAQELGYINFSERV